MVSGPFALSTLSFFPVTPYLSLKKIVSDPDPVFIWVFFPHSYCPSGRRFFLAASLSPGAQLVLARCQGARILLREQVVKFLSSLPPPHGLSLFLSPSLLCDLFYPYFYFRFLLFCLLPFPEIILAPFNFFLLTVASWLEGGVCCTTFFSCQFNVTFVDPLSPPLSLGNHLFSSAFLPSGYPGSGQEVPPFFSQLDSRGGFSLPLGVSALKLRNFPPGENIGNYALFSFPSPKESPLRAPDRPRRILRSESLWSLEYELMTRAHPGFFFAPPKSEDVLYQPPPSFF